MSKARKLAEPTPMVEPLRVSIPMAAFLLGVSKSHLYKKIRAGELRPVKEGAHSLLTMSELRRYSAATDPATQPLVMAPASSALAIAAGSA